MFRVSCPQNLWRFVRLFAHSFYVVFTTAHTFQRWIYISIPFHATNATKSKNREQKILSLSRFDFPFPGQKSSTINSQTSWDILNAEILLSELEFSFSFGVKLGVYNQKVFKTEIKLNRSGMNEDKLVFVHFHWLEFFFSPYFRHFNQIRPSSTLHRHRRLTTYVGDISICYSHTLSLTDDFIGFPMTFNLMQISNKKKGENPEEWNEEKPLSSSCGKKGEKKK